MNNELYNLYSSKWEKFADAIRIINDDDKLEIKPANPLLLFIDKEEEYGNADIRLIVYGQETNSWYEKANGTIEEILTFYDGFFNDGECWSYGGQFWNGVSRFLSSLQNRYPTKTIRVIWNNIIKIGRHGEKGTPPDYIYQVEREFFHVIPDELKIINPNIVLFLTGPGYDGKIKDNFGNLRYEALPAFPERQLAKVFLNQVTYTFRTYHPNYLWRNGIDGFYDTIINNIHF